MACSGIYSLIGFLIFAAFIAYITRDKLWKKAATFLIGLPIIYALNIIRIAIILLIGYQFGEEPAQTFHLIGGWTLIFLGTLLLLTISEKLFKTKFFTKTHPQTPCPKCNPAETQKENFCLYCGRLLKYPQINLKKQDIAKTAAITFALILLLSIQVPVFALTEGPAQIIIQTPTGEHGNIQILPQIQGYKLEFAYRDTNAEQKIGQNASLVYVYRSTEKNKQSVYVAVEIASTKSSLHQWEICLITWPQTHGYQPKVTQLELRDIQIIQNPPLTARWFAFQYKETNQTQLVLYWYETATFKTNTTAQQKQVKISLIAYPKTPEEIPTIENQLLPVAEAIANHWQPIKTWTQIALTLSQNGPTLTATISTLLVTLLVFYKIQIQKDKKGLEKLYDKISTEDKHLLQNITMRGQSEQPNKLRQLERTGIIKSKIISRNDEPILTWEKAF